MACLWVRKAWPKRLGSSVSQGVRNQFIPSSSDINHDISYGTLNSEKCHFEASIAIYEDRIWKKIEFPDIYEFILYMIFKFFTEMAIPIIAGKSENSELSLEM